MVNFFYEIYSLKFLILLYEIDCQCYQTISWKIVKIKQIWHQKRKACCTFVIDSLERKLNPLLHWKAIQYILMTSVYISKEYDAIHVQLLKVILVFLNGSHSTHNRLDIISSEEWSNSPIVSFETTEGQCWSSLINRSAFKHYTIS